MLSLIKFIPARILNNEIYTTPLDLNNIRHHNNPKSVITLNA